MNGKGDSQKPNLERYIASVGWSETCVYVGGEMECSYGGGSASDLRVGVCICAL